MGSLDESFLSFCYCIFYPFLVRRPVSFCHFGIDNFLFDNLIRHLPQK